MPEGALSTDFTVTASDTAGTGTVTAVVSGAGATADVTVTAGPSTPCLIISEYVEGSSFDKGIELYNCGTTDLELSDFGVCFVNNDGPECDNELMLSSGTLEDGHVHTLCHTSASFTCDTSHGGVINHNGDDRYLIYKDNNGSGAYEPAADVVTDAFGETSVNDPNDPWKDKTFRRCDFTPYYGQTAFNVLDYYNEFAKDDVSDFGIAPSSTATCP